jgi:excinuclease UvrABC nuclease subunit
LLIGNAHNGFHGWHSRRRSCAKAPRVPGVYAFVVDDVVVYVGLTKSGLHTRFKQYRRGLKRQRTSARINDRIASTLAAAKRVKVLVATPEPTEWNGRPFNTAAGLEAGLIERIGPIWEHHGATTSARTCRSGSADPATQRFTRTRCR